MRQVPTYAVKSSDGRYYTGRAGEGWLSSDKSEAFTYGIDGAVYKSALFSEAKPLHGLTFEPEAL